MGMNCTALSIDIFITVISVITVFVFFNFILVRVLQYLDAHVQ